MHRIDGPGATAENKFTEGDPVGGTAATVVTDDWMNDVQEELCYAIEEAGITLAKGDTTQLYDAFKFYISRLPGSKAESELTINGGYVTPSRATHSIDTEGDASSDELTHIQAPSSAEGAWLLIRPENNSRVVIVKNEAGGTGQIHLAQGKDFTLYDTSMYLLLYRLNAEWYEVSRSYGVDGPPVGKSYPPPEIEMGSIDPDYDVKINTGKCSADNDEDFTIRVKTAITKQIDAAWAEGDNAGGFPSGLTLTADTWYHVFSIAKQSGQVDGGYDTDLAAVNLLADATEYSFYRRLGSVLYTSTGIWYFWQRGNEFFIFSRRDINDSSPPDTYTPVTLSVPKGIRVRPWIRCMAYRPSSSNGHKNYNLQDMVNNDIRMNVTTIQGTVSNLAIYETVVMHGPYTTVDGQLEYQATQQDHTVKLHTHGWVESRGRW